MSALLQAAVWSGAATLVLLALSRFWRGNDGALWHAAWISVAAASAALPVINAVLPDTFTAFVSDGDGARAVTFWLTAAGASSWVFLIYIAGVVWSGFRLASGVLLVGRLCRRSEAVEGIFLVRLRQCVSVPPGLVRTHRRVQVPITAGFFTPAVLLPETWITWDTERLTVVLRHELAHVERGDYRWNLFAIAFEAMFWFSPLARIVSRRIRLSAELASDRSASDQMDRVSYARILVESAREVLAESRRGMLAPGAATALEARVAALTSRPDAPATSSRRARFGVAGLVLAALVASAFVRVQFVPAGPGGDHQSRHAATHGAAFRH